jgi:hypothetical protein
VALGGPALTVANREATSAAGSKVCGSAVASLPPSTAAAGKLSREAAPAGAGPAAKLSNTSCSRRAAAKVPEEPGPEMMGGRPAPSRNG